MFNFKLRFSKKNAAKKCLSLVLSLTIVFSMISVLNLSAVATGSFDSGLGTSADPWIISTPAQFNSLRDYLGSTNNDKYFQLGCDIDLTDYVKDSDMGWNPIGNDSTPFCGQLNGAGYTVSGLWIVRMDTYYVGLFGAVGIKGKLQNINLIIDTSIYGVRGLGYVGGLAGSLYGSIINSHVTGSVGGQECIGGLVGSLYGSIINSYTTANVFGRAGIGGLVGENGGGSITTCYATGSASGYGKWVGGLVGKQDGGSIANCYATGDVSASEDGVGGLVGYQTRASITTCFATGDVEGRYYIGGLVGEQGGNRLSNESSVINCYATGTVYGENIVGGLVGYQYKSSITTCYATGCVSGEFRVGGLVGLKIEGHTTNNFFNTQTTGLTNAMGNDSFGVINVNGLTTAKMVDSSVLTGVMASFGVDWTKRTSDTDYYYYPELTAFANNGTSTQQEASKISARVIRVLPTITDITVPSITTGQTLTLAVPTITSPIETITSQGWQLSANGTDLWSAYTGTALNMSYNHYYLRYYATSNIDTVYSNKVQITVNKLDLTIGTNPTASNVWQGSTLSTSTLTGGTVNGISGSFTWTNLNTVVGATGSFSVTFTPNDSNYNTVTVNITVTAIDKSALTSLISSANMLKSGAVIGNGNGKYLQQAVDTIENAITAAETMANGFAPAKQTTVNDAVSTLQSALYTFNAQVIKKPSDNPKTSDNTNLPALMAIILASLGALIITTRKRLCFC